MKKSFLSILIMLAILAVSIASVSGTEIQRASDGTLILSSYPVDDATKAVIAEKEQIVKLYMDSKSGKISTSDVDKAVGDFLKKHGENPNSAKSAVTGDTSSKAMLTSGTITQPLTEVIIPDLYQQPQIKNYYCGPTTASEIIKAREVNVDQATAAVKLMTETFNGTPWYADDTNKYVMQNCLNYHLNTTWYVPASAPSSSTLSGYVMTDIGNDHGVAANVNEVANDKHLPGHPVSNNIAHWVAMDGYKDSGSNIHYADSVYNAPCVSWYQSVTAAYNYYSASNFAYLVSTRGIIW